MQPSIHAEQPKGCSQAQLEPQGAITQPLQSRSHCQAAWKVLTDLLPASKLRDQRLVQDTRGEALYRDTVANEHRRTGRGRLSHAVCGPHPSLKLRHWPGSS